MIDTAITKLLGLRHPIVLAPMGSVSGGHLAAAVSNAGGLGLVGGGYGDPDWLRRELACVQRETDAPWGAGLITWSIDRRILDLVLGYRPAAVMLSFGDPAPYAESVKAAGAKLICQVQDVEGAKRAANIGADVIVAQGTEGGGHGGARATLPLVPAVVDAVPGIPVLAAGGIADGRGLAAALMLGAQGALIGTRFYASIEALGRPEAKQRIAAAKGDDTARTRVFDVVRGYTWPREYPGRALRNTFMAQWEGREQELAAQSAAQFPLYKLAAERGDYDTAVVWAGEVVDLIHNVESAATLVERIATEAVACLKHGARLAG